VDISIKAKLNDNLLTSVLLRSIPFWTFNVFYQKRTRNYSLRLL